MSLPLLHLSGSPYQQGFEHGQRLRTRITHNVGLYFDRFKCEARLRHDEVLSLAERYLGAIAQQHPDYAAGMRGIADGSRTSLLEIAALNVRYEILYCQSGVLTTAAPDGCTAFAVMPGASASGHLLMGQNWDWIPGVQGAILHTAETGDLDTLSFTEAGVFGGKIGLNSKGLGLVINGLTTTDDDWERLDRPFHMRCYDILRSPTLEKAARVVTSERRACSSNFILAQAPDKVVDLEAAPDTFTLRHPVNGSLVHTNHFLEPDSTSVTEPPSEHHAASCHRQARMTTLLQHKPITLDDLQRYLRDHDGFPNAICRHPDSTDADFERYATLTSIIMDLNKRAMYLTDGPPCETTFEKLRLA